MKHIKNFSLPPSIEKKERKAKKLEWITIGFLSSSALLMYLVMGSSQAMKTAWLEDILSLLPAICYLISLRINEKKFTRKFPYGYHRVFSISYLVGAVALFGMGLFLIVDSSLTLIHQEHPTIGSIKIFDHQVWLGWLMIFVLIYTSIPAVILGQKKLPLAQALHNKLLYTDAQTQKADYQTGIAAILGILGIGAGWWWADAVAAIVISFSILKDGLTGIKTSVQDLMDRHPVTLKNQEKDPLVEEVENLVASWDWVEETKVRLREHGQVYLGEVTAVPNQDISLLKLNQSYQELRDYHWKLFDISIVPVSQLPGKEISHYKKINPKKVIKNISV